MASDKGEGKTVEKKSEKHRFLSDMNLSRLVTIVLNPKGSESLVKKVCT